MYAKLLFDGDIPLMEKLNCNGAIYWNAPVTKSSMAFIRASVPDREFRFLHQHLTWYFDLLDNLDDVESYCTHLTFQSMCFQEWKIPQHIRTLDIIHTNTFTTLRYNLTKPSKLLCDGNVIDDNGIVESILIGARLTNKHCYDNWENLESVIYDSNAGAINGLPPNLKKLVVEDNMGLCTRNLPQSLETLIVSQMSHFTGDALHEFQNLREVVWLSKYEIPVCLVSPFLRHLTIENIRSYNPHRMINLLSLNINEKYATLPVISQWPVHLMSLKAIGVKLSNLPKLYYLQTSSDCIQETCPRVDFLSLVNEPQFQLDKISSIGGVSVCDTIDISMHYPGFGFYNRYTQGNNEIVNYYEHLDMRAVVVREDLTKVSDMVQLLECKSIQVLPPKLRVLSIHKIRDDYTWPETLKLIQFTGPKTNYVVQILSKVPKECKVYFTSNLPALPLWVLTDD